MSHFPTRKSFKSLLRDRPKHSGKLLAHTLTPRKGGAGRGNVGRPGDELNQPPAIDRKDPNYVPEDEQQGAGEDADDWLLPSSRLLLPSPSSSSSFSASIADYAAYKAAVKTAAREFLQSRDLLEFSASIAELGLAVFHQDLPYIVVKFSLDLSDDDRRALSSLLLQAFRSSPPLLTQQHIAHSVVKLVYSLPDLLLDVPNARTLVNEFAHFFLAAGMLTAEVWAGCERYEQMLGEEGKVQQVKERIDVIVSDFFLSEDEDDCVHSVLELQCPALHHEIVKQLVRRSFDRTNRQRELCSRFLCYATPQLFSSEAVEYALSSLLGRVEDIALDLPDVLALLSLMIARAVTDEVVPPSFVSRVDVAERDGGAQVLAQVRKLLQAEGRVERMERCWMGVREADAVGGWRAAASKEGDDLADSERKEQTAEEEEQEQPAVVDDVKQ